MKKIIILWVLLTHCWQTFWYTPYDLSSANKLAEMQIIEFQKSASNYRLDDTISRREFMKVITKTAWFKVTETCDGKFQDVGTWDWWCKYIEIALKNSYIASNNLFRPSDEITKAESMKLILKARWFTRMEVSWDWREDDMISAHSLWIIDKRYDDFNTYVTRAWIFRLLVTKPGYFTHEWTWNWSSNGWDYEDDDWRNRVP